MTIRFRWFRLRVPQDFGDLTKKLLQSKFERNSLTGFLRVLDEESGEELVRYLWRTKIAYTILDENGVPVSQEMDTVSYTDFCVVVRNGICFLRIKNPGRSVQSLLNAIELLVGFGFVAEPVSFQNFQPNRLFEKDALVRLVGLKVVGAVVNKNLVARMEFAAPDGMAPDEISQLRDVKYKVDSAVYEVLLGGKKGQISFTASGLVKVGGSIAHGLAELLETELPNLIKNKRRL